MFAPFHSEYGRSDAGNTINEFVFTPNRTSAFENFTIVDDDVLEFDEVFIAVFSFGPEIANNWNARKVHPSTAFILIRDDDCELFSDSTKNSKDYYICSKSPRCNLHLLASLDVVVNFNEDSYTVSESGRLVNISVRIDGKFFVPMWAIIEIRDGTATGVLGKYTELNIFDLLPNQCTNSFVAIFCLHNYIVMISNSMQ